MIIGADLRRRRARARRRRRSRGRSSALAAGRALDRLGRDARARGRPRRRRGRRRRGDADGARLPADPRRAARDRRSPTSSTRSTPSSSSIGGGVSTAGELLLRARAPGRRGRSSCGAWAPQTEIRLARYGPQAGVRGAALLARTESCERGLRHEDRLRLRPRRRPASRDACSTALAAAGHEPVDLGTADDYPDIALRGVPRGGATARPSAASSSAAAAPASRSPRCKIPGIRATVAHDTYTAGAVRRPRRLQRALPRRPRDRPADRRRASSARSPERSSPARSATCGGWARSATQSRRDGLQANLDRGS